MTDSRERRRDFRFATHNRVEYRLAQQRHVTFMGNLSVRGMFVEKGEGLTPGEVVQFTLQLEHRPALTVTGQVVGRTVDSTKPGAHVLFSDPDGAIAEDLRAYIAAVIVPRIEKSVGDAWPSFERLMEVARERVAARDPFDIDIDIETDAEKSPSNPRAMIVLERAVSSAVEAMPVLRELELLIAAGNSVGGSVELRKYDELLAQLRPSDANEVAVVRRLDELRIELEKQLRGELNQQQKLVEHEAALLQQREAELLQFEERLKNEASTIEARKHEQGALAASFETRRATLEALAEQLKAKSIAITAEIAEHEKRRFDESQRLADEAAKLRLERAEFERERAFGGRTSSAIGPDLELVRAQLHEQEAKLEERARFVTEQARELAQRSRELEDLREQLTVRDIELQEREELRLALKEATRASEVLQTQLDELRNELGAAEVRQLQSSEEHTAVVQTARREEEARQLEVATLKAELQQAYDKLRAGGRNGEGNDSPPLDHERATLTKQLQELDQRRAELHAMRDSIEQEAVARSKQTQAELKHLRDERAALDGDRQLREQGWVQLHAERASVNRERTAVAEQLSLLEVQRRQLLDGMAPDETKVADAEVERLRQQVEAGRQVALERDRALNALKSAEERAREQDAEAVRLRGELDAARQAKGPSAEAPSPPHRVADSPVVSATTRDRFRPLVAAAFGLVLGAVLVWFTRGSDSPPSPVAGAPAATVQAVVAQTAEVSPLPASLPSTWVAETAPTPLVEKPKKKKPQTSDELFEDAFK